MKKKQKSKYACIVDLKPYTVKQKNNIFFGKVLCWTFLISFPAVALLAVGMSWNIRVLFLIWGILSLTFAVYNLIGLNFKWDHARVCTQIDFKKKIDIRNAWSKEDTKDSITAIVLWATIGVLALVVSIYIS
ncbi:MAG: hypothetical protein IJW22_05530 [Clostridia bacterium]|nr:hypothetical protein [Clostridia bacterium]